MSGGDEAMAFFLILPTLLTNYAHTHHALPCMHLHAEEESHLSLSTCCAWLFRSARSTSWAGTTPTPSTSGRTRTRSCLPRTFLHSSLGRRQRTAQETPGLL